MKQETLTRLEKLSALIEQIDQARFAAVDAIRLVRGGQVAEGTKRLRDALENAEVHAMASHMLLDEIEVAEGMLDDSPNERIVKNARRCGLCGAAADRYATHYQCQENSCHVGDLIVGIFSDLTPPTD